MSAADTLQLVGFANPVGLLPAFLHPVFASAPQSNTHYLQSIDDNGHITGFEEADLTGELIAAPQLQTASVGEAALYAFGPGPGDPVLFGHRADLSSRLAARRDAYRDLPVLYLAVVEFCGLDEMKTANQRAYRHLVQHAGATMARSWRDSQIVLPIIRSLLAAADKQPNADHPRLQRISIYSTAPSRLRVQAEGFDPNTVSNILRGRKMREALANTGLTDKVTIALVGPPEPRPAIAKSKAQSSLSPERQRSAQRSSVEMALEELVEHGLSPGLRRWLEDFVDRDFRKKSDEFPHYVLEWCDHQPVSRAAFAYARLLGLESIPLTLFREISHWLVARTSDEDVGPVYPPAIALLRAREARYLTPSRRAARGAVISTKQASSRTPKPLITDELRESEIPLRALQWIEENRASRWTPQVLQALIELPFDLPPVLDLVHDWLKRQGRRPETGRLLMTLLRAKNHRVELGRVIRDVARWVDQNFSHDDVPRLLTTMLARTQAAKGSEPFDIAAQWVQRRKSRADMLPVLAALLKVAPNDKALTRVVLRIADTRTDMRAGATSFALLLNNPKLPDDVRWRTEHWLEENAHHPAALAVFEAYFRHNVLRRRKPGYARRALALIHEYPMRAGVGPLFAQLLAHFPDNEAILDDALDWLTEFADPGLRGRPVVLALLRRENRERRARIRSVARRWLASHPPDSTVAKVLDAH